MNEINSNSYEVWLIKLKEAKTCSVFTIRDVMFSLVNLVMIKCSKNRCFFLDIGIKIKWMDSNALINLTMKQRPIDMENVYFHNNT